MLASGRTQRKPVTMTAVPVYLDDPLWKTADSSARLQDTPCTAADTTVAQTPAPDSACCGGNVAAPTPAPLPYCPREKSGIGARTPVALAGVTDSQRRSRALQLVQLNRQARAAACS